jgi:hypothetical protein
VADGRRRTSEYARGALYGLATVCIWAGFIVVSRLGVRQGDLISRLSCAACEPGSSFCLLDVRRAVASDVRCPLLILPVRSGAAHP